MKLRTTLPIVLLCVSLCSTLCGQENYSTLTRDALKTMWQAEDSVGLRTSFDMYERAFLLSPDSIDETGLYKASVLASKLREYDKAFRYLTLLMELKPDFPIAPNWSYVVGESSESEYKNLLLDLRWKDLRRRAMNDKRIFYDGLRDNEKEFYATNETPLQEIKDPKALYQELRKRNKYMAKQSQNYSISFAINDSVKTSFFVHLPIDYNPDKSYPLLFFLHGAVRGSMLLDYQLASWVLLDDWNRYYLKYADRNDVVLVFPRGSRHFNWMVPDDGFCMVPKMLKLIKKAINVDDNKVFISGHSNGATGSFSYLMKQPTSFAGFYGFNTYPKVFTGGTFVENIKNRSFINFSTDKDYYYPPNANDDFTRLMKNITTDYEEYRYHGFPHWFPQFDESEPAYRVLFADILKRQRNPFPKEITWEFDDERYGNIDWLSNIKLDTLTKRKDWHEEKNFKINRWLEYDERDSLVAIAVDRKAFDFPRKSGKVVARYDNNVFRIETSRIKSFSVNISPEMVDTQKKVQIYVNGKLRFNRKIGYDLDFMRQSFIMNQDRVQVWINQIEIKDYSRH
ncbi:MAG: hypothetical protein SPI72_00720 [Porphyromonas sp.]|nr:hypothetical protein [Porphyromonas sp.]